MEIIFIDLLKLAYLSTGVATVYGYWPTIKELSKNKPSASATSYKVWTIESGVGFLYVMLLTKDIILQLSMGITFICCAIILILRLRIKSFRERILKAIFRKQ